MSEKKQNIMKIVLGVVAALAAGEGVNAAGLELDPGLIEAMKSLGLVGAVMLIAYFHFTVMPEIRGGRADLRLIANKLAPLEQTTPAPEIAETVVDEQAIPAPVKRVATAPHLRALKPHKDPK